MSKPTKLDVSPQDLMQLLSVDHETGELKWYPRDMSLFGGDRRAWASWNARFSGKAAFTAYSEDGYRVGVIFGKRYMAHRVVFCLAHGHWPMGQVDHINGLRDDNRPANLRLASNSTNHKNQKMPSTNTSGTVGVSLEKRTGAWVAQIFDQGKRHHLGTFRMKADAIAARRAAEAALGYHPNHGRKNA